MKGFNVALFEKPNKNKNKPIRLLKTISVTFKAWMRFFSFRRKDFHASCYRFLFLFNAWDLWSTRLTFLKWSLVQLQLLSSLAVELGPKFGQEFESRSIALFCHLFITDLAKLERALVITGYESMTTIRP